MELPYKFTADQIISEGRTTKEDVETIKMWLSELDDETVPTMLQDETIVLFLLSCSNDINLTKYTVITHYKCKKDGPEIFDDRNLESPEFQKALNTFHVSSIPTRTDENYVIHYFSVNDTNYKNFELGPIMKITLMLLDVTQEENPPNGFIVVFDMEGLSLMHLTKFKLGLLKKYLKFLQEGLPIQLKAIHLLNTVYFIDKVLALMKAFMKAELINMLKMHPPGLEQEKIFEFVPKKCLPKESGGDLPSTKELHERTLQQFRDRQLFWDIEEKIRKQTN